jgi:hypothetical protein
MIAGAPPVSDSGSCCAISYAMDRLSASRCCHWGSRTRTRSRGLTRSPRGARTGGFDGRAHRLSFVRPEIVENDDVLAVEGGHKELLDVGEEALAIDGAVEQAQRFDQVATQGREEGRGLPSRRISPSTELSVVLGGGLRCSGMRTNFPLTLEVAAYHIGVVAEDPHFTINVEADPLREGHHRWTIREGVQIHLRSPQSYAN